MTDLDSPRRNNDCYFYYYSTCTKGDSCTFRHEPSALGCETMCSFWKEGKCLNVHCNYRHMELRKNRKAIQCYWENQPGGCLKPHCPFLHQNVGPSSTNSDDNTNTNANNSNSTEEPENNTEEVSQSPTQNGIEDQSSERNFRSQVDSLVVSFEEESDTESIPTKSPSKLPVKKLRVKTLEEIKLERIQEESAAYFAYSLDHPDNDKEDLRRNLLRKRKRIAQDDSQKLSKISRLDTFTPYPAEIYVNPKIFNAFSKINNNVQENKEKNESVTDLKDHKIKSPNFLGIKNKVIKKNTRKIMKESDTIKIKTLEEIRAEKRRKQAEMNSKVGSTELVEEISSTTKDDDENKLKEAVPAKPSTPKKKVKLIRLASTDLKELVNDAQKDVAKELTSQKDQDASERIPTLEKLEEDENRGEISASHADSEASSTISSNPQKSVAFPEEMLLLGEDLDYEDDGLMNEIDSILSK